MHFLDLNRRKLTSQKIGFCTADRLHDIFLQLDRFISLLFSVSVCHSFLFQQYFYSISVSHFAYLTPFVLNFVLSNNYPEW